MALNIDDLLRRAVESKASDLHLKVGNHPYLRVDGLLTPLTDVPRVTPEEIAVHGVQHDDQPPKAKVQGNRRARHGLWRRRPRSLPRQRLPAAW